VENLFIYGSLQDPTVQSELLGRRLEGKFALLDNHVLMRDWPVEGKAYPRLWPHSAGCVIGQVVELTIEELEILDRYETDAYERTDVYIKDIGPVQTYYYNRKK
jgi:gamma-glutamylcyclotransferase (GGCT)/AIG2-like uncharacterized protein YtfP